MSGRYRHDQGKKTVTDHHTGQGFGLTGHFREGPPSGILHVPSWAPPAIECPPHTPVIEVPVAEPVVMQVPDAEINAAIIGITLLVVAFVRKFC